MTNHSSIFARTMNTNVENKEFALDSKYRQKAGAFLKLKKIIPSPGLDKRESQYWDYTEFIILQPTWGFPSL